MIKNRLQENSVLMNSCFMNDVCMVHVCFYICTLNAIEVIDIIWPFRWFSFSISYMIILSQFFFPPEFMDITKNWYWRYWPLSEI
jgi:hypothetical protein